MTKFALKIMVFTQATFLDFSYGNNIITCDFPDFAESDIKG